jgi:hypothetical protein
MRVLVPATLAGLIGCALPALAHGEAEAAKAPFSIPGKPAGSPETATWRAVFSPYTMHFSFDSEHKPVVALGLQRERPDGIVWGGAVFDNSFGQPSAYAFAGKRLYGWSRWEPLYAELTAGLLYGYTGEYRNKVPFNYRGFSPGIVASIGWQFTSTVAGQINLLGSSALMFQFSVDLP